MTLTIHAVDLRVAAECRRYCRRRSFCRMTTANGPLYQLSPRIAVSAAGGTSFILRGGNPVSLTLETNVRMGSIKDFCKLLRRFERGVLAEMRVAERN